MPGTRHLVLAGAGLVGAATAATSAASLFELAQSCGIPGPLAAALPIALDAGAAVAALVWITEQGELRAWGRGVAVTALVATLAGNGLAHAITSGLVAVTLPLVLAVGACIPGMLFAVVHLAALMARPVTVTKRKVPTKSPTGVASPPAPAGPPPEPARLTSVGGMSRAVRVRELVAEGVPRSTAYRRAANGN